ncbi:hypothetical protein ACWEN6_25145 [Sphaerisporangium sp. NPDC004334]
MAGQVGLDSTHVCAQVETPSSTSGELRFPASAQISPISVRYAHLPALMKVSDVQRESGLSKTTVFAELKSGRLKSVLPTPKTRRIPREWFVEWLETLMADARREAAS